MTVSALADSSVSKFVIDPIPVLSELGTASQRKLAAFAYVTRDWLSMGEDDLLICDASDASIACGRTSRELITRLASSGVHVYSNELLHAKLAVFDHEQAFIGSANLSQFASQRVECGILTSDRSVVEESIRFIYRLQQESILVDDEFLSQIAEIEITRPEMPKLTAGKKKSLARLKADKDKIKYWFFKGTHSLSKPAQETGQLMRHTWQQTAEEATVDDDEDVSEDEDPLELSTLQHSDARWKTIKKGDKVFWCYRAEDWGWIVLPPRTVVDLREHGASLLAGVEGRYWDHYRSIYRDQFLEALELKPNTALKSFDADDPQLCELLANWDRMAGIE